MRKLGAKSVGVVLAASALGTGCSIGDDGGVLVGSTSQAVAAADLYTPQPNHGAIEQLAALNGDHAKDDVDGINAMIHLPQAVWFTDGTPQEVEHAVRVTMARAQNQGTPVLVAYNLPFRDCAQYSAGGAIDTAAYEAWIDGFAAGIGDREALVILEPDGLGIIPYNGEWCEPTVTDEAGNQVPAPGASPEARYEQLNYAVDRIGSEAPHAKLYLDATHSAWLGVDDIAQRLDLAGVDRTQGFFLNVSNYQFTANLVQYGTWISKCLAADTYACANQYWNGGPPEWTGVALDPTGVWSDDAEEPTLDTSLINLRYDMLLGDTQPTAHFVIDTSRNGAGPWALPDAPGDPQDWCNPPDRGLGPRPTTDTGIALVDAFLWVKIPGESDGECNRWLPWGSEDPVREMYDPPAGEWFPEMALELVHNADPPLD